ncbi:cyclic peptide export ABC transporter [Methylosinus sp. Sm6]|uniref:cyclic peptide export ABC transporter n=1 Tax=Methylosinus sp. Sm6 TaxID=2866948 RepID=UPI0021057B5B|nr:cyclic peptide export ABC transporter [Methylosinus sp. Sm6]
MLALSVASGLAAGVGNGWLLTFINRSLAQDEPASSSAFFGLCFAVLFSGALSMISMSRIAQENLLALRLGLSKRILSAPLSSLRACGPHRLTAALTDDVNSIVNAQEAVPLLVIEISKLVAALVYLAFLSPGLLAFVLFFLVFGVASFRLLQSPATGWLTLARKAENELFDHFRSITDGHKELKMDARRRRVFLDDELRAAAAAVKHWRNKAWAVFVLSDRWGHSLYFLLVGAVLFLSPMAAQISRSDATGFALVVLFLSGPISVIVHAVPAFAMGVVALRNIESLELDEDVEPEIENATPAFVSSTPSMIELIGVAYRYASDHGDEGYRLGPLNLALSPGELVFVTGGNGSGKTTLALLLVGLVPPDEGEIRFGGHAIVDANRESYRQNFSVVFADAYVFNSLMGYAGGSVSSRADELLRILELDHKLRIEDGRFSTIDLSRGQRKRLALLAAYLEDRPIYVFDEWAAEQDPQFREFFYRDMLPDLKARGKTVIVITHDDRYFHLADRRLHLTMGRLEDDLRDDAPARGHEKSQETADA